jgi:2-oxo-3-hexenedioate decarboxylase
MSLTDQEIASLAERVDTAALDRTPIAKLTNEFPGMDWEDAYAIQHKLRERVEARGQDCQLLFKAGLTSHAKMEQMGVKEPVFGFLQPGGQVESGGSVPADKFIHPRVEAEIAIRLKQALSGPDCTVEDVLAATGEVLVGLEIIDSRYENFNFDLKSVIADNTSAAGWVLGEAVPWSPAIDLVDCTIELSRNGELAETATGAAVLGHPAQSVAMLANLLNRRGEVLPAGALVLTGGASAAIAVKAGDRIDLTIQGLGALSVMFT